MSLARLGKKHSLETREKIGEANRRRKHSIETREKLRQARLGQKHSLETIEKLREIALQPEIVNKRRLESLGNKHALGHEHSVEIREKIRQARLRQHFPLTDIEKILCREFEKRRLRFGMHKAMWERWQPDFVFGDAGLFVQADGGYWHNRRHPRNLAYDAAFDAKAAAEGWTVFRFSGTEIKMHPSACARAVARFLRDH